MVFWSKWRPQNSIYLWASNILSWMQKADHKVAKGKNCQNSWDDIKAEELQTIQPFSVRPLDGILLVLLLEGLMTESGQSSPLDLKTSPLLERFLFSRQDRRLFHGGSHPFHLPPCGGSWKLFLVHKYQTQRHASSHHSVFLTDFVWCLDSITLEFWLTPYLPETNLLNLCLKW